MRSGIPRLTGRAAAVGGATLVVVGGGAAVAVAANSGGSGVAGSPVVGELLLPGVSTQPIGITSYADGVKVTTSVGAASGGAGAGKATTSPITVTFPAGPVLPALTTAVEAGRPQQKASITLYRADGSTVLTYKIGTVLLSSLATTSDTTTSGPQETLTFQVSGVQIKEQEPPPAPPTHVTWNIVQNTPTPTPTPTPTSTSTDDDPPLG